MKKLFIFVLTGFLIIPIILLPKTAKAQNTTITGQFLYGLQLYVLPEKQLNPDYTTAIYSRTIDENDFLTSGLYQNWMQPRLPDNINGYIYIVDANHTINNVKLGGGFLEEGQQLSYPYTPKLEMKQYNTEYNVVSLVLLNPVNMIDFDSGYMDYIVYFESNDGTTPRIKLIDATTNINDYNRVKLAINGYDTGYNDGYAIGYNNGQRTGYESGFTDGQNNGYNTGYNQGEYTGYYEGYDIGYQNGLNDAATTQYAQVQYYKQISHFTTSQNTNQSQNNISYSVRGNDVLLITIDTSSQLTYGAITNQETNNLLIDNHRYLLGYTLINKGGTNIACALKINYDSVNTAIAANINERPIATILCVPTEQYKYIQLVIYKTDNSPLGINDYVEVGNIFIIDLTDMYGIGNEPTTEECEEIFTSYYYPQSDGELLNINYLDGYATGELIGYDNGISYQATQQLTSDGWIKNIFSGIGSFLAIELFPNVSIGLIVGIPFVISVAWFVIKMARGGGSN